MQYAPKLLCEGVEGVNRERMRQERAARARQVMKQHGVASLLVTGPSNIRYLEDFVPGDIQPGDNYLLFFAEHDSVMFANAGTHLQSPDQAPWIRHWRPARSWLQGLPGPSATKEEIGLWANEIAGELRSRGLASELIGVMGYEEAAVQALQELGLKVVDGTPILMEACAVKTQDEIICLKNAASITSVGFEKAKELLRPGVSTRDLTLEIRNALLRAGAEDAQPRMRFGPQAFPRSIAPVWQRLEYGDLGYVLLCRTSFLGYRACIYRSFLVGRKPTVKEMDWYKRLRERLDRVIDALRPGATTADAAQHFPPASTWGLQDECEVLTVEFGHGIGLCMLRGGGMAYNPPIINRQWSLKHPQPILPGMVIAVESLEGEWRAGGVRLEDMVVVTEQGPQVIDHYPRDEIIVVGA